MAFLIPEQPDLFTELSEPQEPKELQPGQGTCHLCGRPQAWRPRISEWSRYCGDHNCTSNDRICQNPECQRHFQPGIDGRTKYCSKECMWRNNTQKPRNRYQGTPCAWCDSPAQFKTLKPAGEYVCKQCQYPLRHVWQRLETHHVPIDLRRQLASDPTCQICGAELLDLIKDLTGRVRARLVVDHDHSCCPGSASCGKCVRGLICNKCNTAIGLMQESVEALEQAAAYLRSHKTRAILREGTNGELIGGEL